MAAPTDEMPLVEMTDAALRTEAQTAFNDAMDPCFTDAHRVARFARHLAAEAERSERTAQEMAGAAARLEAMSDDELADLEAVSRRNVHVIPVPGWNAPAGAQ